MTRVRIQTQLHAVQRAQQLLEIGNLPGGCSSALHLSQRASPDTKRLTTKANHPMTPHSSLRAG